MTSPDQQSTDGRRARRPALRRRRTSRPGKKKNLTVTYWRIVDLRTGHPLADTNGRQIDWSAHLANLTPSSNGTVFGRVYTVGGQDRLVLAKDRDFAPRQRDSVGQVSPMPLTAADNEVVEETFVSFLPGRDAFAMARSSVGAPTPPMVGEFLMSRNIPARGVQLKIDPVVDNDRFARAAASAQQASWLEVIARPGADQAGPSSMIGRIFGIASDVGDNIKIEIKVSADNRTADASAARERLFQEATAVAADIGTDDSAIEGASVKVLGEVGPIDLVRDRIVYTGRATIDLAGTNRSLNEAEVFKVIDQVTAGHAARISRCLGAPSNT